MISETLSESVNAIKASHIIFEEGLVRKESNTTLPKLTIMSGCLLTGFILHSFLHLLQIPLLVRMNEIQLQYKYVNQMKATTFSKEISE